MNFSRCHRNWGKAIYGFDPNINITQYIVFMECTCRQYVKENMLKNLRMEKKMIRDRYSEKIRNRMSTDDWLILQENYNPKQNLKYESLFTIYYRE